MNRTHDVGLPTQVRLNVGPASQPIAGSIPVKRLRPWPNTNPTLGLYVSVYYVAVRTIVLSHHGNNLARPVIIHDIIHSLMCMPSTPNWGFSGVSPDGNCAYVYWGSFTSNSKSVGIAIWFTWFSEPHNTTSLHDVLVYTATGSPRRSLIQLWTRRDVA